MTVNGLKFVLVLAGIATALVVSQPTPSPAASAEPANQGTVALPPGGPTSIYPQNQTIGGANPFVPFGTDPFVPYGVWGP